LANCEATTLDFNVKRVYLSTDSWQTPRILAGCSSAYIFILWVVQGSFNKKKCIASASDQGLLDRRPC